MTERLYYRDSDSLEFAATVIGAIEIGGGHGVVLDRTAFYPTSGGQPFDTGVLGEANVVDVVDEGERIVHVVSQPLPVGATVRGVVDAWRRRDHMQQHTGQHILSAAFDTLFSNPTSSFHMGGELSTIDLQRVLSPQDVERAVDEANRIVWDDRPVTVRFEDAETARQLGLRKASAREGRLRLVDVEGFDLSACGGTHVSRTGAVGCIGVTGTEKFKGGLRVSFACGARAVRVLRELRDAVAGSVRSLSVLPAELPGAIQRLQADGKDLRKRIADLQGALAVHEAGRLLAEPGDAAAPVAAVMPGWDAVGLKAVASAVIAARPVGAVLATSEHPVLVVVGRSGAEGTGAADVVRALTERFGGKGGGTRELAQAGGLSGAPRDIVDAAKALLR